MLIPFDAFAILNMFVYPVSSVVSEVGCYVIDFLQYYNVIVLQTTSFYTSLFRYLCVAHQPFLSKHGLTSKVHTVFPKKVYFDNLFFRTLQSDWSFFSILLLLCSIWFPVLLELLTPEMEGIFWCVLAVTMKCLTVSLCTFRVKEQMVCIHAGLCANVWVSLWASPHPTLSKYFCLFELSKWLKFKQKI